MGGPGSGRQKKPATLIAEAKEKDTQNLPKYFERLSGMALDGDREALFYLIDRHLGKAKAQTEIEIKDLELLGAGAVVELFQMMEKRQQELLEERRAFDPNVASKPPQIAITGVEEEK